MKKLAVVLFVVACLASVFVIPRIVYGTFSTFTGKITETVISENETLTWEQAQAQSPTFARNPEQTYVRYKKYLVRYYGKFFWLRKEKILLEEGLTTES